jgi:hypothetical protein
LDGPAAPQSEEESIGELFGRLIEDGRGYAEAEIELYAAIARYRAKRARRALVSLAAGWFLLIAAMMALTLGAFLSLASLIGPMWAGLAIAVPLGGIGYVLASMGWTGIKGLGRDQAEREALERAGKAP